MEEIKFNGYRLDVALKAQSPMIHFQADEPGATLRGSEVKPKLDRFLNGKISADNKLDESAYIKDKSLNYKLSLQASGEGEVYSILDGGRNKFAIIYGDRNKKLLLRDATLTIICMNEKLRQLIEDNIVEFFAVTNFGYMQNKGFGGFMPAKYVYQYAYSTDSACQKSLRQDMANWLKATYGSEHCYYMDFSGISPTNISDYNRYFKEIKDFYDLLKTGRNRNGYSKSYIYQYFHQYSFNNEKAWMKSNGIAPVLNADRSRCAASTGQIEDAGARYVKALLGIAPKLEYLNAENNPREKVLIKIDVNKESSTEENKPEIDRMESPIFFKIVGRHVFIIAKLINENIYGREFDFNAELKRPKEIKQRSQKLLINENNCRNGKLKVPSKKELGGDFTIDKLLSEYVRYYNGASPGESGRYLRTGEAGNGKIRDYALASGVLRDNKYVHKVEEEGNE